MKQSQHIRVPLPKPIASPSMSKLQIPANKVRPPSLTHRRNNTGDSSRLTPTNEQAPYTDRSLSNQVFAEYQQMMFKTYQSSKTDDTTAIGERVSKLEDAISKLELAQDSIRPMIRQNMECIKLESYQWQDFNKTPKPRYNSKVQQHHMDDVRHFPSGNFLLIRETPGNFLLIVGHPRRDGYGA